MITRKTFPARRNCHISVVTEQMADSAWAVVASVRHFSESSEKVVDLPVPLERFSSQADAEAYGVRLGEAWIQENAPPTA
jgi:hypothetical protein